MHTSMLIMQARLTNTTIFPATSASTACRECVLGGRGTGAGPGFGHPVRRRPAPPDIAHNRKMAIQAVATTMTTTRATAMTRKLKAHVMYHHTMNSLYSVFAVFSTHCISSTQTDRQAVARQASTDLHQNRRARLCPKRHK